jgi:alpha-ketoglutarate-dependent taurine dioxygenase
MQVCIGGGQQLGKVLGHGAAIAERGNLRYRPPIVAKYHLPRPGQPFVVVQPDGERSLADLDRESVVTHYSQHGALLFRGFDADLTQFGDFAWRFCKTAVVNETPGRNPLDPARLVYGVDGGQQAFALHPEISREPWKPDVAMFACLSPPGQGGYTTLCDGVELVRALPAEVREGLADRWLVYPNAAWAELLEFWLGTPEPDDALLADPPPHCPYTFQRAANGRVVRFFSTPALHKPMFAQDPAFGNFLLFARFVKGRRDFPLLDDLRPVPEEWLQAIKAAADPLTIAIRWHKGDVLMLDNTRFMHGRTAITDPVEREIATFFGYLDFAVPAPHEQPDPIWRRANFEPPRPPDYLIRNHLENHAADRPV